MCLSLCMVSHGTLALYDSNVDMGVLGQSRICRMPRPYLRCGPCPLWTWYVCNHDERYNHDQRDLFFCDVLRFFCPLLTSTPFTTRVILAVKSSHIYTYTHSVCVCLSLSKRPLASSSLLLITCHLKRRLISLTLHASFP